MALSETYFLLLLGQPKNNMGCMQISTRGQGDAVHCTRLQGGMAATIKQQQTGGTVNRRDRASLCALVACHEHCDAARAAVELDARGRQVADAACKHGTQGRRLGSGCQCLALTQVAAEIFCELHAKPWVL